MSKSRTESQGKRRMAFELPVTLADSIEAAAERETLSRSAIVRLATVEWLRGRGY